MLGEVITSKSLIALNAVVCSCERLMPESAALTDNGGKCDWFSRGCSLPTSLLGMTLSVTTICITSRALFISSTTTSRFVRAELHSVCLSNVCRSINTPLFCPTLVIASLYKNHRLIRGSDSCLMLDYVCVINLRIIINFRIIINYYYHSQHFARSENTFISAVIPGHCPLLASPQWSLKLVSLRPL